LNYNMLYG